MTVASHVHRALTSSSSHNPFLTVNARSGKREHMAQRLSRSTATLSYPHDDAPSPFDIQIFDIFDAPSRLGESSKLLRRESKSSQTSSSVRSLHSSSHKDRVSCTIKPLPPPTIYDGPARPKHMSMSAYRVPRAHSFSSNSVERGPEVHTMPPTLPPPIVFDGPSRLRPYPRTGGSAGGWTESTAASSSSILLLGASGLALYAGSEYYKTRSQQQSAATRRRL